VPQRPEPRHQPGRTDDAAHHPVRRAIRSLGNRFRPGGRFNARPSQPLTKLGQIRRIGANRNLGAQRKRCLGQPRDVPSPGQRHDLKRL